jgi:hypothetical protein
MGAYVFYEGVWGHGEYSYFPPRVERSWVVGADTQWVDKPVVGHVHGVRSDDTNPAAGTVTRSRLTKAQIRTETAGRLIVSALVGPDGNIVLYGGEGETASAFCIEVDGGGGCEEVLEILTNLLAEENCQPHPVGG